MAWMGHPTPGLMPGMATPEELAHLDQLTGTAADDEFLRLMILHHQGGIAMAEAVLERSGNTQVRDLATSIVTAQKSEMGRCRNYWRVTLTPTPCPLPSLPLPGGGVSLCAGRGAR